MIDVVLPSNSAASMMRYLLSDESVEPLKALGGALCLCAQMSDHSVITIKQRCLETGIPLRLVRDMQSKRPSMARLRRLAWLLSDAPASLHIDDNIVFKKGAAEFFEESASMKKDGCGLVLHGAVFGAGILGDRKRAFNGRIATTANGMLWLADFAPFSSEQAKLLGGCEEYVMAANVNAQGLWIGKRFRTPTSHKKLDEHMTHGSPSFIHDLTIAESNCLKAAEYIMDQPDYRKIKWNRSIEIPPQYTEKIGKPRKASKKPRKAQPQIEIDGVVYSNLPKALRAHGHEVNSIGFVPGIPANRIAKLRSELELTGKTTYKGLTLRVVIANIK